MTPARPAFRVKPTVTVGVEVRRADGSVRSSYVSPPEDIATDNYVRIVEAIFLRTQGSVHNKGDMIDITGASRTLNIYDNSANQEFMFYGPAAQTNIIVGDGGGSTPTPASSDFAIVQEVNQTQASAATVAGTKISIGASILNNTGSSKTVREVAIYGRYNDTASQARTFMLFYEDTPDIPVADGESVAVTYTFDWPNDTTNDNWIAFWAAFFSAGTNDNIQASLTDTGGISRSPFIWSINHTTSWTHQDSVAGSETKIEFGDGGGSAVTPAEDDDALVQVLAAVQISTPSRAGGVVTCSATYSNDSGVSKTIREGGLTMGFFRTTNTYDRILMFHFATPDTAVADGASKIGELTITLPYA